MPACSPPICAVRSRRTSLAAQLSRQSLGRDRWRRRAGSRRLVADVRLRAEAIDGDAALSCQRRRRWRDRGATSAVVAGVIARRSRHRVCLTSLAQRGRVARARDVVAAEGVARVPCRRRRLADRRARACPVATANRAETRSACIRCATAHSPAASASPSAMPMPRRSQRLTEAAAARRRDRHARRARPRAHGHRPRRRHAASSFAAAAEALGFIVRADDPRRHVVACAGAPICASAHIAARAIAPRDRRGRRVASRRFVQDSHFRLRQGLRASCAGGADRSSARLRDARSLPSGATPRRSVQAVVATNELPARASPKSRAAVKR